MKSLFNEYWAQNDDGRELSDKVYHAVTPIISEYLEKGFAPWEIEQIAIHLITVISSERRLKHGFEVRDAIRKGRDKA